GRVGIRDFHVTGVQMCALPICSLEKPLRPLWPATATLSSTRASSSTASRARWRWAVPLNLASTVARLGQDYTVTRPGDTVYVAGWPTQPGEPTTFTARGVLYPATPQLLERLPEGDDVAG